MRAGISAVSSELAALGMPAGAKFDAIVDQVFAMQLTGRGKTVEEREKILRKLSGIKEAPKKKEKEKKSSKGADKTQAAQGIGDAARQKHAASTAELKGAAGKGGAKASGKAGAKHHAAPPARAAAGKKSHGRK